MAVGRSMPSFSASGRSAPMGQLSDGTSFPVMAAGKAVSDWFTGTALPWLRDVGAPTVLGAIDPTLKETYVNAKDKVVAGEPWQDVVGGVLDDVTGKVLPKAIGAVAPEFSGGYGAAQTVVGALKGGQSTADILRGGKRKVDSMEGIGAAGLDIAQAAGRRLKNFRQ